MVAAPPTHRAWERFVLLDRRVAPLWRSERETLMAVCGVRNDYARPSTITDVDGGQPTFDSFQSAIHRLAPECTDCGCKIIGHAEKADGPVVCCFHCLRQRQRPLHLPAVCRGCGCRQEQSEFFGPHGGVQVATACKVMTGDVECAGKGDTLITAARKMKDLG